MDALSSELDTFRDDKSRHPAVRIAAARGLAVMNKYYSLTDESAIFRVAMSKSTISLLVRQPFAFTHFTPFHQCSIPAISWNTFGSRVGTLNGSQKLAA